MNTNTAFLARSDPLALKPPLRTSSFEVNPSRRSGDFSQEGSFSSDRSSTSTPRMAGSLRGGLSALFSPPVNTNSTAGQVHRAYGSEHCLSSLDSMGMEIGSLGRGTQPVFVPSVGSRLKDRASMPLTLTASGRSSNQSSSPSVFSFSRSSTASSQPLSVPAGFAKLREEPKMYRSSLFGQLSTTPSANAKAPSSSSLSAAQSRLAASLDEPQPFSTTPSSGTPGNGPLVLQRPSRVPPPCNPMSRSVGFALNETGSTAIPGALPSSSFASLSSALLPREAEQEGVHYACMFQEPEGLGEVKFPEPKQQPPLVQLPNRTGRLRGHLAMQFAGSQCLSPVKELGSAKPSTDDLAREPRDIIAEREHVLRLVEAANGLAPPVSSSLSSNGSIGSVNEELLSSLQQEHDIFNHNLVRRAFAVAASAFEGQVRKNGEPVLMHCVETAVILAEIGASPATVAAGLLHDCLDDTPMTEQQLRDSFGAELAALVMGVSRMSYLSQRLRDSSGAWSAAEWERMEQSGRAMSESEAERLRNVFLSMSDPRVVLIKLADRMHNLRTISALPPEKQRRVASETLELFAPLANRLGIWSWKAEIEDICFSTLWPEEHRKLKASVEEGSRKDAVLRAISKLDASLGEAGVQYHDLHGRNKNLYSIFLKMKNKGKLLSEVFDRRAIRLIVEDEQSCYAALACVRCVWPREEEGHFKDYIKAPKGNGYQSLHIVVEDEDGHPLEIQIRTRAMHHAAEFGVAAHWRYKEKKPNQKATPGMGSMAVNADAEDEEEEEVAAMLRVEWCRYILSWAAEFTDQKVRLAEAAKGHSVAHRQLCTFPEHAEGCCFAPGPRTASAAPMPPPPETEPLLVVAVEENDKVSVAKLKAGSTRESYLHDYLTSRGQLHLLPHASLLVNSELVPATSEQLPVGSVLEVVIEPTASPRILPKHGDISPLGGDEELLFFDAELVGDAGDTMALRRRGAHPELLPIFAPTDDCNLSLEFQRRKLAVAWGDSPLGTPHLAEVKEFQ